MPESVSLRRRCYPSTLAACLFTFAAGALSAGVQSPRDNAPPETPGTRIDLPPNELFAGLRMRNVGPFRGGRVCAVTGVRGQPALFLQGNTGGGVWKTTDAGGTWEPLSDRDFTTSSIGAIAVAPSDTNVIYVGTGESQLRGNIAAGDGVYRSTDGGRHWQNVGLRDTQQIARVVVHPRDAELVYVAAFGHPWGPSTERGIYRSRDGGRHWDRILYVNEKTGAADLAMDPNNPRILYAAFWQAVRLPWSIESGGPDSGLYRSRDGGDTWERLGGGLPQGVVGRIGVAVSGPHPGRVWAIVEAKAGGLYRSDDGGTTWRLVSGEHRLRQRAWYYSWVYADPKNGDTVWIPNVELLKSIDGGHTFRRIGRRFWDTHDLWIDPEDPRRLILGNDGGAQISLNGGETWSTEANQPTAQIYRVATDDRSPYWLYGAQQDQTSAIAIASAAPGRGIGIRDWHGVGGGESGWVAPDPHDPEIVYAGGYGGSITRYDHRTGQAREINAWPQQIDGQAIRDLKYRWNWNAPILVSRREPGVVYHGAQVLLRTRDGGQTWEEASPDLTRNDRSKQGYSGGPIGYEITGVETYDTIFAISESPHETGVLWVGTDDGLVQLTRDGGKTWRNVTPPGLPEWSQINALEVSPHDRNTAYVAATRFKLEDRHPFLYVTRDDGKNWKRIDQGIPDGSFTRVIREDPVRRGLLYAGTETGLFVSLDDGASWHPFQLNLPRLPITDLQVKGDDLVVATQGRGFWILDDLTPLRDWEPDIATAALHLFTPPPAHRTHGDDEPETGLGENPPAGMVLDLWLAADPAPDTPTKIEISGRGRVLRRLTNTKAPTNKPLVPVEEEEEAEPALGLHRGLNRIAWDLRAELPRLLVPSYVYDDWPPEGVAVSPGVYNIRVTIGSEVATAPAEVRNAPGAAATDADLIAQEELLTNLHSRLTELHDLVLRMRGLALELRETAGRANASPAPALAAPMQQAAARLEAMMAKLWNRELQADEDSLVYTPALDFQFTSLAGVVATADAKPTAAEFKRYTELTGQLAAAHRDLAEFEGRDLIEINRTAAAAGLPTVIGPPPPVR